MFNPRQMLFLTQIFLLIGAAVLLSLSVRLFHHALKGGLWINHLGWIIPLALLVGGFKARFVMRRRLRANIDRLRATTKKKWPWQIFPPQMLLFIMSMIVVMHFLKRVFADNVLAQGILGGVDLAVALALFIASLEYRSALGIEHQD